MITLNTYRLNGLSKIAHRMGVVIEEDHMQYLDDDGELSVYQEGYWLLLEDGSGVWEDENFSTSLDEVESKLQSLATTLGLKWNIRELWKAWKEA